MTQLSFGWSFPFALSKEAFTLKAGKFSWDTQEQYDTEKKPNQNRIWQLHTDMTTFRV